MMIKGSKIRKVIDIVLLIVGVVLFVMYWIVDHNTNIDDILLCVIYGIVAVYFFMLYICDKSKGALLFCIYILLKLISKIR